jgi:ribonuclease BN (tRNA processing enzyme)
MRLRVLGCHGGESPSHRTTCFLIDDDLLIDAGAITRGLTVPEQAKINHVVVSHSHLDHIGDLALLADNVISMRDKPVEIYCTDVTADALEKHFFNNVIWPNFTKIPLPRAKDQTVLHLTRIRSGEPFTIGGYTLRTVPVKHPVECHGVFVRGKTGTLVYSGDTGPTDRLWTELNELDDLRAFILEVSFPNELKELAHISGHLTPELLSEELGKWQPKNKAPVLLYGMKPAFHEALKEQIAALADPRLTMLRPMDEFEL